MATLKEVLGRSPYAELVRQVLDTLVPQPVKPKDL